MSTDPTTTPETDDPWADVDLPGADGHDDGTPLTEEQLDDLIEGERTGGDLVRAGEDLLLASPDRIRTVVAAVRTGLLARIRAEHARVAKTRTQAGPRPAPSDLLAEAQLLTRAHESLTTLGRAFTDIAREPAAVLADAMHDHLGPARRSMKMGTPDGGELALTIAAPGAKTSVDEAALLDVVGTALLAGVGVGEDTYASEYTDPTYAAGVRDGITALRRLLGASPGWKSTALDALVRDLQKAGEGALAARADGAYARVESGEPTPRLSVSYDA